jgi:Tol biopolymer transport system component
MMKLSSVLLAATLVPALAGAEPDLLVSRRVSNAMADLMEYDLWLVPGSGEARPLTAWAGPEGEPVWCPARGTVVFTAWRGDGWRLHEVDLAGGEPRPLGPERPGQEGKPTLAPGGGLVAFPHLSPESGRWELVEMDLASGDRRTLLAFPDGHVVQPEWSPAGDRIAFVAERGGNLDVGVLELASGRIEWITDAPTSDREPDFSPDGSRLVYTARKGGSSDLFLVELASGRQTRLTRLGAFSREASFDPDGRGVVFVSHFEGPSEVYRLDLGTGELTRLTRDSASDSNPRRLVRR